MIGYTKEAVGNEIGIYGNSTSPAYVGHGTGPLEIVGGAVFRSIVKALYVKRNFTIVSFGSVVPSQFVGDVINITGYNSNTSNTLSTISSVTIGLGNTWLTVAGTLYSTWALNRVDNTTYFNIEVDTVSNEKLSYKVDALTLKLNSKSTLKFQNRTPADDGTDLTNRNNIASNPVYGKIYYGNGCGTELRALRLTGFVMESSTGVILPNGSPATLQSLAEPPKASMLRRVTKSSKLMLEAGQIKTSMLTWNRTFKFKAFHSWYKDYGGPIANQFNGPGKFGLIALEKMLDEEASPPVNIFYEHNYYIQTSCYIRPSFVTNPIVDSRSVVLSSSLKFSGESETVPPSLPAIAE